MRKVFILLYMVTTLTIYSQIYTPIDFNLKGEVKKLFVTNQKIKFDGETLFESFPTPESISYKTDLNLHYLEFYKDGRLKTSKLFYPRDYYGQFQFIKPFLNLEVSDFEDSGNFLIIKNNYLYNDLEEGKTLIEQRNDFGDKITYTVDQIGNLLEDEYYTYTYIEKDYISSVLKKRKGSEYSYRRLETTQLDNRIVEKEYLNNNFLQSKKIIILKNNLRETIFVSKSKIELVKETYENELLIKKQYITLSWRNIVKNWPPIDFNENYDYETFIRNLMRDSTEKIEEYIYKDSILISKDLYRIINNNKEIISNYKYIYQNNLLQEVVFNDKKYKTYKYDNNQNWVFKEIGNINRVNNNEVRVPIIRYTRTLTYWD